MKVGLAKRLLFEAGADFYDWMTWQATWQAQCAALTDHLPQRLRSRSGLRILDLGVGPGVSAISFAQRLPTAEIVGLDFSSRMLRIAQRKVAASEFAIDLVRADAAATPFPDDCFDAVMGCSVLYLLPDRLATLREVARVLRPDGAVVFLEPHDAISLPEMLSTMRGGGGRFSLSMVGWRAASRRFGRFNKPRLRALLSSSLCDVDVVETLGGLGLVGTAVYKADAEGRICYSSGGRR